MNRTFFLVRHAIKEKAVGEVPITPKGILQASEYIALKTKSTINEDSRLRERANWGDLPEQTFDEFVAMWERCTSEPEYIPPVGDSAKQAGERLSSLLSELAKKHPPESKF
jgi:broad specificity phosphatase PhoE